MRACIVGLCLILVSGGPATAQAATPLDAQTVLQEMSARMMALDSFHQVGQMSSTLSMGQLGQGLPVFTLETWYEKPNRLATKWGNLQTIYDGTYGYFYAEGSPLAYRYPAAGLPAGWQQWSSQMALGGAPSASYTPEIMQWLTQSATAYQAGNDIHVTFTLTGEQLMQITSAMGMGVPGMPGGSGAEGGADIMQVLSQILGGMQMNWDVVLDASTYMVCYLQGQVGMPTLGFSTDFMLQFTTNEANVPVPPEVFVLNVPAGVEMVDGVPPPMALGGLGAGIGQPPPPSYQEEQ